MTGRASADGSRGRHPSARSSGAHLVGPTRRLSLVLSPGPGPHWAVAAAAIAVRGTQGRSQAAFALAYGLDAADVVALERGDVAAEKLPAPLRVLTPIGVLASKLRASGE